MVSSKFQFGVILVFCRGEKVLVLLFYKRKAGKAPRLHLGVSGI